MLYLASPLGKADQRMKSKSHIWKQDLFSAEMLILTVHQRNCGFLSVWLLIWAVTGADLASSQWLKDVCCVAMVSQLGLDYALIISPLGSISSGRSAAHSVSLALSQHFTLTISGRGLLLALWLFQLLSVDYNHSLVGILECLCFEALFNLYESTFWNKYEQWSMEKDISMFICKVSQVSCLCFS